MKAGTKKKSLNLGKIIKSPWFPIFSYLCVAATLLGVVQSQFEQAKILVIILLVCMGAAILAIAVTSVYQFYRRQWLIAFLNLLALPLILFMNFKIFPYIFRQIETKDSPGILFDGGGSELKKDRRNICYAYYPTN